jgi:hypothetical protein
MTGSLHIDLPNEISTFYEPNPDGCTCDWNDWISIFDWPPERKNKHKPFRLPKKDGKYYVRVANESGDRYEEIQNFTLKPRKERCGYTGEEFDVNWSGNYEEQPYAWRELKNEEIKELWKNDI